MTEALRRTDDGTEARPFGRHSVCATCRWGKTRVTCKHEWRSPLDKPPDFGEEAGPIRTYHVFATCMHPDMGVTENGLTVHPDMADVVRCEFREPRAGTP